MTVYYFVGIKGSGMSALAQILHNMGLEVRGSDVETHYFTQDALDKAGIPIYPFNKDNIQPGMTVIAGNAFPDTHEEIRRSIGIRTSSHSLSPFFRRFYAKIYKYCSDGFPWKNINNWVTFPCHGIGEANFLFNR